MNSLFIATAFLTIPILLIFWGISIYNRLIALRNLVENTWSQVDVQLRRRFDLIPNLVETVKGYAAHEKEVIEQVSEARSRMMSAKGVEEQAQANNMLTQALKSLFAIAEAYPELKANQNFIALQEELSGTETSISNARETYNDAVMSFNTASQIFPANIIASTFGFESKVYYPVEEEARQPVKVDFK